jgi:hypothetical protein
MAIAERFLDRYLDPLAAALSPEAAQAILGLQPDAELVRIVEEYGQKASAGRLTDEEREDYRALANAGTLVSLLKAKARRVLARQVG